MKRTFLQRLLSVFRREAPRAASTEASQVLTPMSTELIKFLGNPTHSGKSVSDDSSFRVAAVWACRRILSESLGMISWSMYERKSDNTEKADTHWLQDLLVHSPNEAMTGSEFREALALQLTGQGNAYSMIERTGKRISSLTPMFTRVDPKRKAPGVQSSLSLRDGEVFFRVDDRGKTLDLPRDKVWHVPGFGFNGLLGLSPIGIAREAIGGALAMEEFANRFFSQGGAPAGTVSFPGWLTEEQRGIARESLQRLLGGLGKAHQFAMFEGGVKPEPWNTMNLEDMQFILGRKFSVLEICRIFRIPPHMVADLEKGASYASIEQMSMDFVMFTLMPYFTRIENSVSKWLLSPEERRRYYLRFNFETLLRADSKSRAEFEAIMVTNGIMTRNEVRAKENLNKATDKNMDAFTVQLAMAPIEKLGEKPEPTQPPPPPQQPAEEKEGGNTTNIVIPEKVVDERGAALFVQSQAALLQMVADLGERVTAHLGESNARLAEAHAAAAGQLEKAHAKMASMLHDAIERIAERDSAVAESLRKTDERISAGLAAIARQRRKIVVGGEEFVSEPVDEMTKH